MSRGLSATESQNVKNEQVSEYPPPETGRYQRPKKPPATEALNIQIGPAALRYGGSLGSRWGCRKIVVDRKNARIEPKPLAAESLVAQRLPRDEKLGVDTALPVPVMSSSSFVIDRTRCCENSSGVRPIDELVPKAV